MLLLVSGKHRPVYDQYPVGHLVCPRSQNRVWSDTWAADNAAFSHFDSRAYLRMLDRYAGRPGCLFVTVPDVVGDAARTRIAWDTWKDAVWDRGFPAAYVLQDGSDAIPPPWDELDALFVGGTTAYKLSAHARDALTRAHHLGKWTHMGRVNTTRRLRYAQHLGLDSIDGSGFARFPDEMLPRFTRTIATPTLPLSPA